jgi:mRNA interferase HigB
MRIIAKRTLREYWEEHPDVEQHLKTWHQTVKKADWQNANDVKKTYGNASVVGNNRVVFNIKGNHYRLIAKIQYQIGIVFIRFIGTHEEYDKIDATEI